MTRDLAAEVNANLREAIATLADHVPAGETRQFGPLTAVASGLPVPLFNRVFVFDRARREEFAAAVSWLADREVPFWVTVADPAVADVEAVAADLGLVAPDRPQPGMALPSLDELERPAVDADVSLATDEADLEAFAAITAAAFDIPPDVARRVVPPSFLESETVRFLVGRVDGDPVACGQLVRTGDVAGVYSIGVLPDYRRRGLGEALTREVLRLGRDAGCDVGVLQSSEMAESIYDRMGFETVTRHHQYEPAD